MKIYSDDPNLPFKYTKLSASYTKAEIDGELAKWGIKQSMWNWDPEHNEVFVEFRYTEVIQGITVSPVIRVEAPAVWSRAKLSGHGSRGASESINWNVSLRVMYWFIHSHLAAAYLTQSSKTAAFLPYIKASEDGKKNLADVVIGNLERIQMMPALEAPRQEVIVEEEPR